MPLAVARRGEVLREVRQALGVGRVGRRRDRLQEATRRDHLDVHLVDVAVVAVVMWHTGGDEHGPEPAHRPFLGAELDRRRALEHRVDLVARVRVAGGTLHTGRHLRRDHVAALARVEDLPAVSRDPASVPDPSRSVGCASWRLPSLVLPDTITSSGSESAATPACGELLIASARGQSRLSHPGAGAGLVTRTGVRLSLGRGQPVARARSRGGRARCSSVVLDVLVLHQVFDLDERVRVDTQPTVVDAHPVADA